MHTTLTRAIIFLSILAGLMGCAEGPRANLGGSWAYEWQDRADETLHGTLTLTQEPTGLVHGELGLPTDYPDADLAVRWWFGVTGQVTGDTAELYAVGNPEVFDDPWWFYVDISGEAMEGPEYAGDHVRMYTFKAVRQ